jgi:small Trp-rich protein
MWLMAIGVLMLIMNLAGVGPVGQWSWSEYWWAFLLPFLLAFLWWSWSDWSGLTQRRAMEKIDAKREARRQKSLDALGLQKDGKRKK